MKTKVLNYIRNVFKFPKLEKRLSKKTRGKSTNHFYSKLVPNTYQYEVGTYRIATLNNIKLKVDLHDYIGHYHYFGFKDAGLDALLALVNKGDIVLDIGTNIGSTLLQFAKKIGDSGIVYGFEPDNLNYNRCLKNIKLNTFTNISVEKLGLGNEKGEFNLVVDTEANRGGNRISYENKADKKSSIIKVDTLDAWFETKKLKQVDLIKIDVEGFEYKVLTGGVNTIKQYLPTLFIELDDNNLKAVGDSAISLIELLYEYGYKSIVNAETESVLSKNYNFSNCHFDIIVTK